MRIILFFSILISTFFITNAQNAKLIKDSFTLTSNPMYDVNGNYYRSEKKYDHLPTKQDSIDFDNHKFDAFRPIIDSVEREVAAQQKRIEEMNREYYATHKQIQYAPLHPRVGKHLFALHWISWQKFGSVEIKKINSKKYSVKGSQKDEKGNYVTIDGVLIPVVKGKMTFIGIIVTKKSGNNYGLPCIKNGTYTFLCAPDRKYWRLQEKDNCEGNYLVDYVDIFF
jgi:hypothetical protein